MSLRATAESVAVWRLLPPNACLHKQTMGVAMTGEGKQSFALPLQNEGRQSFALPLQERNIAAERSSAKSIVGATLCGRPKKGMARSPSPTGRQS